MSVETKTEVKPPEGWTTFDQTPGALNRIVASYLPALTDDYSIEAFINDVRTGFTFVGEYGWVCFTLPLPNASCRVHGAKWKDADRDRAILAFRAIIRWVLENGFLAVIAPVCEANKAARKFLEDCGFTYSGFEPFRSLVNGEPKSVELFFITRADMG